MDQWGFTSPFEGVVPHLYLDTAGNVTAGVGFLIPDVAEVERMPWLPSTPAAVADWTVVHAAAPGRLPDYYRAITNARLTPATMQRVFADRVAQVRRQLGDWHLPALPEGAQIALVDMAYNIGVGGLSKFLRLKRAIEARDWTTAAAESHRAGVQEARNAATAGLFMTCEDVT